MPDATRLEWIGKYAAILSALVAMAVGIGQYRRGVSHSMRELEWRQADIASAYPAEISPRLTVRDAFDDDLGRERIAQGSTR